MRISDWSSDVCSSDLRIELGSPDALDADGIVESVIIADDATLDGALVEDGVATFDVPRNVVITGAASVTSVTFTITGTDVFGDDLVETITGPTGATAASGKKAFKTVTAIAVSATTTAAVTVGTGDVLGLPVYRSEEHTSELQSLMRISYAVFCLKKKNKQQLDTHNDT